jgi:glutathione peroxidase
LARSLCAIVVKRIDGNGGDMSPCRAKVLLIVNVASRCGLTPRYKGLDALCRSCRALGLEVLGVPVNNFKEQEPGIDAEISQFCSLNYDVHVPVFSKISVRGSDQHPRNAELTQSQSERIGNGPWREERKGYDIDAGEPGDVLGNLERFLVSRRGKLWYVSHLTRRPMIHA